MKLSEIIKSSFATLKMNGRRTFLTMFGIIIGIAAVITILSLGNGFRKQTLDELAKDEQGRPSQEFYFNVTNMEADWEKLNPFNQEIMEEIEALPGVDEVKTMSETFNQSIMTGIRYGNSDEQILSVFTEEKTDFQMIVGRNLNETDSIGAKRYVILDDMSAMTFFEDFEAAIHQTLEIEGDSYTIVGIYMTEMTPEEMQNQAMYGFGMSEAKQVVIPKGTHDLLKPQQNIEFSITAYYNPDVNISSLSKQISEFLKENGPEKENGEYAYFDTSEMMKAIGEQLNMITYFIGAVAGISLFIAGVGVMNMMYISVSERTKEIGIRRSMGATQRSIQWQFLLEGISITTLGGVIGYLMGVGIAIIAGNFLPFKPVMDIPTALLSVAISIFIGISFSVFPARAASRKNVVEILR